MPYIYNFYEIPITLDDTREHAGSEKEMHCYNTFLINKTENGQIKTKQRI